MTLNVEDQCERAGCTRRAAWRTEFKKLDTTIDYCGDCWSWARETFPDYDGRKPIGRAKDAEPDSDDDDSVACAVRREAEDLPDFEDLVSRRCGVDVEVVRVDVHGTTLRFEPITSPTCGMILCLRDMAFGRFHREVCHQLGEHAVDPAVGMETFMQLPTADVAAVYREVYRP